MSVLRVLNDALIYIGLKDPKPSDPCRDWEKDKTLDFGIYNDHHGEYECLDEQRSLVVSKTFPNVEESCCYSMCHYENVQEAFENAADRLAGKFGVLINEPVGGIAASPTIYQGRRPEKNDCTCYLTFVAVRDPFSRLTDFYTPFNYFWPWSLRGAVQLSSLPNN